MTHKIHIICEFAKLPGSFFFAGTKQPFVKFVRSVNCEFLYPFFLYVCMNIYL